MNRETFQRVRRIERIRTALSDRCSRCHIPVTELRLAHYTTLLSRELAQSNGGFPPELRKADWLDWAIGFYGLTPMTPWKKLTDREKDLWRGSGHYKRLRAEYEEKRVSKNRDLAAMNKQYKGDPHLLFTKLLSAVVYNRGIWDYRTGGTIQEPGGVKFWRTPNWRAHEKAWIKKHRTARGFFERYRTASEKYNNRILGYKSGRSKGKPTIGIQWALMDYEKARAMAGTPREEKEKV